MIFGIKLKMYNFDPYNVLLAIPANIPASLFLSERHAEDHRPEEAHLQVSSRRIYLAGEDREHLHPQ